MAAVISLPVCDPRTQASGEQSVKAKLRHPFRRVPGRPRGGRNFVVARRQGFGFAGGRNFVVARRQGFGFASVSPRDGRLPVLG